jgi:hypothetical protein
VLNASCPSGTPRAPVRPATRSTTRRAFAPTSFRRPRLSDESAPHTLPIPAHRTVSSPTLACAPPTSQLRLCGSPSRNSRSVSASLPHLARRRAVQSASPASSALPPSRSSSLRLAQSVGPVPVHGPGTPRAFEAVGHPGFGRLSSLTQTHGGGLTPACSGLATLAADARR